MEFRTVQQTSTLSILESAGLLVVIWHEAATPAAVELAGNASAELSLRSSHRISVLAVITEGAAMPDAAGRQALSDMMRRTGDDVAGSALVIEGDGVRMSLVRGVMTAIQMLRPAAFPVVLKSSVKEAVHWLFDSYLGALLPTAPSTSELDEAAAYVSECMRAVPSTSEAPSSARTG